MTDPTKNYMEVNIGGKLRKVKFDMRTAKLVTDWLIESPNGLINPFERTLKSLTFALSRKENDMPSDFDDEMLSDWISDMEQSEYDELEKFANTSLGFMVAMINQKFDQLQPTAN